MRWTQKDPLNLFQDPKQGNRYSYAGSDPVNNADPTGQNILCDIENSVESFSQENFWSVYGRFTPDLADPCPGEGDPDIVDPVLGPGELEIIESLGKFLVCGFNIIKTRGNPTGCKSF